MKVRVKKTRLTFETLNNQMILSSLLQTPILIPGSSAGKESAWNAGDPSSIPRLGRFPAEGIGYPFLYSRASLVAQTVKNLPTMWEPWVQSLGWEDPLEEGMATQSSILAWRIPMDRGAWQAAVHGVPKSQTWLGDLAQHGAYFVEGLRQSS